MLSKNPPSHIPKALKSLEEIFAFIVVCFLRLKTKHEKMCYNVPCNYVQAIIIVSHIILIVLIKTLTTTTNQLPALDNVQPFLLIISNMKIIQCSCMKQFVVGSTL